MKLLLEFHDSYRSNQENYLPTILQYRLTRLKVSDIFTTTWCELNEFHKVCYLQIHKNFDYLKVRVQDVLIYSGCVLEFDELQYKLKQSTRKDSKKI